MAVDAPFPSIGDDPWGGTIIPWANQVRNNVNELDQIVNEGRLSPGQLSATIDGAVEDGIADRGVVEGKRIPFADVTFGIRDLAGHLSWLATNSAGEPPEHTREILTRRLGPSIAVQTAESLGIETVYGGPVAFALRDRNRRAILQVNRDGTLKPGLLLAADPSIPASLERVTRSRIDVVNFLGDSLTEGGSPGQSYPSWFGTMHRGVVNNYGRSGMMSAPIAIRTGAAILTTTADAVIPASGSVTLTVTHAPFIGRLNGSDHGTLYGVPGTLAYGTGVFTRDEAGAEVAVPAGSQFSPDVAALVDWEGLTVAWPGQNDLAFGWPYVDSAPAAAVAAIAARMTPDIGRLIVLGVHTGNADYLDDIQRQNAQTLALLQTLEGVAWSFIDVQEVAVTRGLAMAGLTPTSDDLAAMSAGLVPPSLLADGVHFNDAAKHHVIAASAYRQAALRDWI